MPKCCQELLDDRADGDAGGGFAGAGAFEDVAGVGKVVFDGAGEIGMAGPRAGDRLCASRDRRLRPAGIRSSSSSRRWR